jgi:hypothetical protein
LLQGHSLLLLPLQCTDAALCLVYLCTQNMTQHSASNTELVPLPDLLLVAAGLIPALATACSNLTSQLQQLQQQTAQQRSANLLSHSSRAVLKPQPPMMPAANVMSVALRIWPVHCCSSGLR